MLRTTRVKPRQATKLSRASALQICVIYNQCASFDQSEYKAQAFNSDLMHWLGCERLDFFGCEGDGGFARATLEIVNQ